MHTGPTPVAVTSEAIVAMFIEFIVTVVQAIAATTGGALVLGLIALLVLSRGRHRYR